MSCLRYGQTWGLADRGGHERKQSLGLAPNVELEGWCLRRAKAGRGYTCPWWADERVYGFAFMQGKGLEFPQETRPI